jgi:peptidoglycan hydrolase-like protein with peptidoglycan-binding domain
MVQMALADDGRGLQVIISRDNQSLAVYDNGALVATSKVSTGKPGHSTPTGIFSILEKRKYHESNIYSNAPMPFMQRLTWSGIALHEGNVPNYPASHGCVRLPSAFAKSLYGMTERGIHVIISDAPVVPHLVQHATLFQPRMPEGVQLLSDIQLRPATFDSSLKTVEVAMNETTGSLKPTAQKKQNIAPLRILITRRGERERMLDIQAMLNTLGFDAGTADGHSGPMTTQAINGFKRWKDISTKGPLLSEAFLTALYALADEGAPPEGQIMVRQDFKPLFEAPVRIKNADIALGTHFYEATSVDRQSGTADWYAVTLENHLPSSAMRRLGIDKTGSSDVDAARRVLDRIEISADVRKRIEDLLSAGSSMTVSDISHGVETGQGTDFITITRQIPSSVKKG